MTIKNEDGTALVALSGRECVINKDTYISKILPSKDAGVIFFCGDIRFDYPASSIKRADNDLRALREIKTALEKRDL